MKRTADHWLAVRRRMGVEAALKRRRSAVGATRRKAGWIAEANPDYFMKITTSFRCAIFRQELEGLAAQSDRPVSVHARAIIGR
ncbi:hypothetical protein Q3A80_14390 [Burkholderia sp. SR8]|jgi:hypothetical protein|uniref:hypothetical protein n=1 Tax=Burkholderia sp. SR8 TaxID=3062277 RepID=UPI0040642BE4